MSWNDEEYKILSISLIPSSGSGLCNYWLAKWDLTSCVVCCVMVTWRSNAPPPSIWLHLLICLSSFFSFHPPHCSTVSTSPKRVELNERESKGWTKRAPRQRGRLSFKEVSGAFCRLVAFRPLGSSALWFDFPPRVSGVFNNAAASTSMTEIS